jgi:hypothetical protein
MPHGRVDEILPSFPLIMMKDASVKKPLALEVVLGSNHWSLQTGVEAHQDCVPRDRSCTLSSVEYNWHSGLVGRREPEDIESSFADSVLLESVGCIGACREQSLFGIPHATEVL